MRRQYHFRPGPESLRAWDVDRLVALTEPLPVIQVPVAAIRELDEDELPAKQFVQDPAPDHVGVHPDDLPYEK